MIPLIDKKNNRPIVLVANSSWYLFHYRKKLIESLKKSDQVITISPFDENTKNLELISLNILWKINRSKENNIFSFSKSLLRMILIIRTIKPKLIHSHTIKANLVIAFVSFIFDIPNILSFTGLGRLSNGNIIARNFLKIILKIILFLSTHKLSKKNLITHSPNRGYFIFQNPRDLDYFFSHIDSKKVYNYSLIYGSGLPKYYFTDKKLPQNIWINDFKRNTLSTKEIDIIFCGRLIKAKGIDLFLEIAKSIDIKNAFIFGSKNHDSINFLTKKEILFYKKEFENINFLGNIIDPLLKVNSKNPILIVPSLYGEGISRTILEAMCLGIPVICSKNAAVNVFTEKVLYISKGDEIKDYINCIEKVKSDFDNNILNEKLHIAKSWCISNFKEEKIVNQTKKLYSNLKVI